MFMGRLNHCFVWLQGSATLISQAMKKIIQSFNQLTFVEKATLAATWLQTIAVVLGITIAIFQLQAAVQQTDQGKRKESIALIEQFNQGNVSGSYSYLSNIHRTLSYIAEETDPDRQMIMLEQLGKGVDIERVEEAYATLDNFYEKANTCYRTEVCEREIIGGFVCERSTDFLNLNQYPERKNQIAEMYKKFYKVSGKGDVRMRATLDSVITIHVWNVQRVCPLSIRMRY